MAGRNFVVTIKEGNPEPISLWFELHEDIGLAGDKLFVVDLQPGTSMEQAREIARALNKTGIRVRLF